MTSIAFLVFLAAAVLWGSTAAQRRQRTIGPFVGVTADGTVTPGLYRIEPTGVSTAPVRAAAVEFLAALTQEQRRRTSYPVDDLEWRQWSNTHSYRRQGVSFKEMSEGQKQKAWGLISAGLSAQGVDKSRNIMALNGHLAELINKPDEYGEGLYWLTLMGEPSATDPWGWQLDGHHLVINFFVLADQVVMTPAFMGSEPVTAESGRYKGASIMQPEQDKGLAFIRSLTAAQRAEALIPEEKRRGNNKGEAFNDNLTLPFQGLRADRMTAGQKEGLLLLVAEYINNMREGHAGVRLDEIRKHLAETYFGWIGDIGPDGVFYYRIHSPVVLIEFDHQGPIALGGDRTVPTRRHIHSLVRTPNGNDYGKDLLKQHYEAHRGDAEHGHRREWGPLLEDLN